MRISVSCAILLALALQGMAAGAETCPWLNAATAGGALSEAVTAAVTHEVAHRADAVCTFTGEHSRLRIDVRTVDNPRTEFTARAGLCVEGREELRAIGNEAVICGLKGSVQVVGRVRNRIFVLVMNADDSATKLRDKARALAEAVAGNLF